MSGYDDDRRDDRRDDRERSRSPERGRGGGGGGGKSTGIALKWNEKGFGFIKPDDGGEDIFCHFSSIIDGKALQEGTPVEYDKVYDDRKGKDRAEQVTGGVPEESVRPAGGGGGGGDRRGAPPDFTGKEMGTALRWNEKGFGFIKPNDGGEDIFCHFSCIEDGNALQEGTQVGFVKVRVPVYHLKTSQISPQGRRSLRMAGALPASPPPMRRMFARTRKRIPQAPAHLVPLTRAWAARAATGLR